MRLPFSIPTIPRAAVIAMLANHPGLQTPEFRALLNSLMNAGDVEQWTAKAGDDGRARFVVQMEGGICEVNLHFHSGTKKGIDVAATA